MLETADPNDDRQFMHLVLASMQKLGLTKKDVAHMFGTSISTVERWVSGKNAPHPIMRPIMYKVFLKGLDEN